MACIDSVVNITCLYLQYPFNKKYYDQYCICAGNYCTYFLTKMALNQRQDQNRNRPQISDVALHSNSTVTHITAGKLDQNKSNDAIEVKNLCVYAIYCDSMIFCNLH